MLALRVLEDHVFQYLESEISKPIKIETIMEM